MPSLILSRPQTILALAAGTTLATYVAIVLRANYVQWLSLGRGGLPSTPLGWVINWLAYPLGNKDLCTADSYYTPLEASAPKGDRTKLSFLQGPLAQRSGTRPAVPLFVIPQRQTSAKAPVGLVRERQEAAFAELAQRYAGRVQVKQSGQEGHGAAIWLTEAYQSALPAWAEGTRGEIAHIHWGADNSAHCTLSLRDAREVVGKGWGQRHMLSGVKLGLFGRGKMIISHGYTMIYAPRTVEEVDVQMGIFEAAIRCMSGQDGTLR